MSTDFIDKLFCEDCTVTMQNMITTGFKVDCILTSPPYNTVRNDSSLTSEKYRENNMGRYDVYVENKSNTEYIGWTVNLFELFDKVLKPNGVVIYNLSYGSENTELMWRVIYNILEKTNFTIGDNIIWKKYNALPNNVSKNRLTRICEYIYVFCRKNEFHTYKANKEVSKIATTGQIYYKPIFNFIEAPNNDGKCDLNKATFSTELVNQLLDIYIGEDGVVYDPFIGTGTTAVACKSRRIGYVGSEISEAQVEYANNRLQNIQLRLI